MEEDNIIYFNIYKKYLAYAMSFLGFNFRKRIDYNGKIVYIFQRTQRFDECFNRLLILKNQYGNYQKDYL